MFNWHFYWAVFQLYCDIFKMTNRRKKSVKTVNVENYIVYNFCLTYFHNNTYRFLKKCNALYTYKLNYYYA